MGVAVVVVPLNMLFGIAAAWAVTNRSRPKASATAESMARITSARVAPERRWLR